MIFEKIKKSIPPKITNKIKIKCVAKVRFANNSYIFCILTKTTNFWEHVTLKKYIYLQDKSIFQ